MTKPTLPILLLAISGFSRGQETAGLFAHWNAPQPLIVPVRQKEYIAPIVLLRDASQFKLPGGARLAQGSLNMDGSVSFFINIKNRAVLVLFNPRYMSDGKPNGGTLQLLATLCGGPHYEFVKDSAAEKDLLKFMRDSLAGLLDEEDQGSKETGKCGDVRGDTVAALAGLFWHFPSALNPE